MAFVFFVKYGWHLRPGIHEHVRITLGPDQIKPALLCAATPHGVHKWLECCPGCRKVCGQPVNMAGFVVLVAPHAQAHIRLATGNVGPVLLWVVHKVVAVIGILLKQLASFLGIFAKVNEGLGRCGENFQLVGDQLYAQAGIAGDLVAVFCNDIGIQVVHVLAEHSLYIVRKTGAQNRDDCQRRKYKKKGRKDHQGKDLEAEAV